MAQQTAFQWFIEQLKRYGYYGEDFIFTGVITSELIEQAKQMEKEQKKYFFDCGRQFQLTGEGTFTEVYDEPYKK